MANIAEQSHDGSFAPSVWLSRILNLGKTIQYLGGTIPEFLQEAMSHEAEEKAVLEYRMGLSTEVDERALGHLHNAGKLNPWVGEPLIERAARLHRLGRVEEARHDARAGVVRLLSLGVAWDKRKKWDTWLREGQRYVGAI